MNDMLPNTPQKVRAANCARIPKVTRVQLCSRLQQVATHRVDQHPAVTAVPEKPRAPIMLVMRKAPYRNADLHFRKQSRCINRMPKTQQSYSCLRAVQFCTRFTGPHAASWGRGLFAIHVRVSSNCTHTYRSRWGRATRLSNWAQGLNMERLRAQAPWRSHTQTREPHVRQQGGGARVVCDPGH